MKLVVIIPALNEEESIADVIQRIQADEVIVVDDGSKDQTAAVAAAAGATVVKHLQNRGLGAAFATGIEAALKADADIIINIDADGQMNPADIPTLIQPILDGQAEFVTATRYATPNSLPDQPTIKRWGNKRLVQIINFVTGKKFTDVSCGFRAYTRETALRMTLFGKFTYTHETFVDLAFKGITMAEVPITVRGEREYGKSRLASNLWRFALKAAIIIFRAARDYKPFYFFGIPGLLIFLVGVAGGIFLLVHYLQIGQTAPYRSLVSVSGIFIIVGFLMLFLSMLADMLHRNRMLIEQQLYLTRKQAYKK